MKKQTQTLLLLAGAGALAYFFFKGKKSGAQMIESAEEGAESTETGKGAEKMPIQSEVDAVIDTTKTGQTIRQAIQQGKKLATALKDANIIIKTPAGQSNISIKTGAKKPSIRERIKARKVKRKAKMLTKTEARTASRKKRAERIKSRRTAVTEQKTGKAIAKGFNRFKFV